MCGGNLIEDAHRTPQRGLSPLVRGKRLVSVDCGKLDGSIPACAGETRFNRELFFHEWVYPRLCGGNIEVNIRLFYVAGLSPLVRGKLLKPRHPPGSGGSIPACAGETIGSTIGQSSGRVYPRLCGGNEGHYSVTHARMGLSPLVRGKRKENHVATVMVGSIPACAGETV